MNAGRVCLHCIVPPYMLREIAQRGDPEQRSWALQTLSVSERFRGRRQALAGMDLAAPTGGKRRTIFNGGGHYDLPGTIARPEGAPPSADPAVNEAYDGAGATYDFYWQAYRRRSIDGRGMRLDATVHYGSRYDNAFWDGTQMVYGDGDGRLFRRFTAALEVIGHELNHGVIQHEARLVYEDEPGALNESFADVFGALVKQHALGQTAEQADWLIGGSLFTKNVKGKALRSMKSPGTAYDDPVLGRDPQPAHMKDYVRADYDNGGVHINSGIPNRAFYETAAALGGYAWDEAGRIWYEALCAGLRRNADFAHAAAATRRVAQSIFGLRSAQVRAVSHAWDAVGVAAAPTHHRRPSPASRVAASRSAGAV